MIDLYIWNICPYCKKVLRAANDMGLQRDVDYRVIDGAPGTPGRETVRQRGGKEMVPFLIDGDVAMYESDDIIDYLRKKKGA